MKLIMIPFNRGTCLVQAEEIIRIESRSNYSKIFFANGKPLTVAKVLHWFEDHLPVQMFTQLHRSHLVNKVFMHQIMTGHYSSLLLSNGESIPISRRKKNLLKVE